MASYRGGHQNMAGYNLKYETWRIKRCNQCGGKIVFVENRHGKWYPVNFQGLIDVSKVDYHRCSDAGGA